MADKTRTNLQRQTTPKKLSFIRRKSTRKKESAFLQSGSSPQGRNGFQKDSPNSPAGIDGLTPQSSPGRGDVSEQLHSSGSSGYSETPSAATKTSTPQDSMRGKSDSSWSRSDAIILHQKLTDDLEQGKAKLANIAGILMELSESYYDLMSGFCWCCHLRRLDVVVQESLAAYERRVVGQDQGKGANEWTNLIACQIEGRCRRNTVLAKHTYARPSSFNNMPDSVLKAELTQMDGDVLLYDKRIERDEAKIKELGTNWANDKQTGNLFRLCRLKKHVRKAIMDYSMDLI